jgi:hypothetical protein
MDIQKKVFEFNLNIGVPNHDVNSDTFLSTLTCITDIIGIVNSDLSPSRKLEVRVKALKTGSFECECFMRDVIANGMALFPTIISLDLHYYKEIIGIVIDIFKIKQFLKGEKPSKIETSEEGVNVCITGSTGVTVVVDKRSYNYYAENQAVNDAVSRNFDKLNSDTEVSDFRLKTIDRSFVATRQDFSLLQQKRIVDDKKIREITHKNELLYIFKLVWDSSNKWGFVWNGIKIQAYIKDDTFFKRIDKGERFAKGDTIRATIKIYQIYDNSIDNWVNDTFEIIEVSEHTKRAEQIELKFEQE